MENLKKRLQNEHANAMKFMMQSFIEELLPVVDNFERSLAVVDPSDEIKNFLKGYEMIYNQLMEVLKSQGVEAVSYTHLDVYKRQVDMGAVDGRDPYEDYVTINKELGEYQYRLLERPQIVVANKMDEDGAEENLVRFKKQVGEDVKIFPISAIIHDGVDQVLYAVADALATAPTFTMEDEVEHTVLYTMGDEEDKPFELHNLGNGNWQITGKKIERMVAMTSLVSDDSLKRLLIKMRNMGVDDALRNAGAQDGDNVAIGEFEFDFYE